MNDAQLAHLSVLTALNKMMRGAYFDICVVDAAVKALGSVPDRRAYDILRPLHCVHWSDIPREIRDAVPLLVERCLNVPAYQFTSTQLAPEQQASLVANTIRALRNEQH